MHKSMLCACTSADETASGPRGGGSGGGGG